MDYHRCLDILHQTEKDIWVDKINEARKNGALCAWITSLLPGQAPYHLDGGFLNGSYNLCQKLVSNNGTVLLLRFPRKGSVSNYADEKVTMEVEALDLIRKNTTIPVPQVHAWGLAETNPLDLGPFMLMEFIDGVCLKEMFLDEESKLLKEDIPDCDVKSIYRQMANFMLQLFNINLPHIGSLPTPTTGLSAPARPLTRKAHDILQNGSTQDQLNYSPQHLGGCFLTSRLMKSGILWLGIPRSLSRAATSSILKCSNVFWMKKRRNYQKIIRKNVSKLVKWSEDSGAMWLHMLLSSGFFDWLSFPCMQLRQRVGAVEWRDQMDDIKNTEEVQCFVAKKMRDLEVYDERVD